MGKQQTNVNYNLLYLPATFPSVTQGRVKLLALIYLTSWMDANLTKNWCNPGQKIFALIDDFTFYTHKHNFNPVQWNRAKSQH